MTAETLSRRVQNLISYLERVAVPIKNNKREPELFKEEFRCIEMLCLCIKTHCYYDNKSDKLKFSSKGLNKQVLEDSGDSSMAKNREYSMKQSIPHLQTVDSEL